jgi:hypothetical protein
MMEGMASSSVVLKKKALAASTGEVVMFKVEGSLGKAAKNMRGKVMIKAMTTVKKEMVRKERGLTVFLVVGTSRLKLNAPAFNEAYRFNVEDDVNAKAIVAIVSKSVFCQIEVGEAHTYSFPQSSHSEPARIDA